MTPVERAAYQRGMEAARSVMVAHTVSINDERTLAVLSLAFRAVTEEIAKVTGIVPAGHRVDYLALVQEAARQAVDETGMGGADRLTPIGILHCWATEVNGKRYAIYKLNGERVTVKQIIALGLAQRPTSRDRKKK